jgi:hypothetical protein
MYGQKGMSYFFSDNVTNGAPPQRLCRLAPALQFEAARAEGFAEYRESQQRRLPQDDQADLDVRR